MRKGRKEKDNMFFYSGDKLEKYETEDLEMSPSWKKRDFTNPVCNYLTSRTEKIFAVSGLRGTGKTVGTLQAAGITDTLYISAQKGEPETGKDYIDLIKKAEEKYIIIDEYGWIRNRDQLDRYLLTGVQNGKRIVITGTESITLDFLNYGALNHRVDSVHTTMFTYDEYKRIYGKKSDKNICREYLVNGGVFKDYAIKNFDSMKHYVEEAIVGNLAGYLKGEMTEEKARTLAYSVLYKAICPSNLSSVPTLRSRHTTLPNFLDTMGINTAVEIREQELNRVAEIFEEIGLIIRIKNYDREAEPKEQYYIANPSLTCQLILAAYGLQDVDNSILGHVFESCVMTELSQNKLEDHDLWFLNNSSKPSNENNMELDAVITDRDRDYAYLFECKFSKNDAIHSDATLISGKLEKEYFEGTDIEGRYLVYNGQPLVKRDYAVGTVACIQMGTMLDNYFEFGKNIETINLLNQKQKLAAKKMAKEEQKDLENATRGYKGIPLKEKMQNIDQEKQKDIKEKKTEKNIENISTHAKQSGTTQADE